MTSLDEQILALENRVAQLHEKAQALNKQAGQEAQATKVYKQFAALDDQALDLRLAQAMPPTAAAVAAHAVAGWAAYCSLPQAPPPSWHEAAQACHMTAQHLRLRAVSAVLGAALADAAACGMQWVYGEAQLAVLAQGRPGLEFYNPPQCPFFDYGLGRSSPYGEQTQVLLQSLVQAGGLDCCQYAASLYETFGVGFPGYRDRSTKAFLRAYAAGQLPPMTGSKDDQANAFTRLPPLVALYAGASRQELLGAVERMIRVTQNDDRAVAYGCAAALVLEQVVMGSSVTAAMMRCMEWLQQRAAVPGCVDDSSTVPPAVWSEVAASLWDVLQLAAVPPLQAAAQLGRNCHLPNSLQTPLHVMVHMENRHEHGKAAAEQTELPAEPGDSNAGHAGESGQQPNCEAIQKQPGPELCLPCSLGAGSCPLPARLTPTVGLDTGSMPAEETDNQQAVSSWAADAYVEAVRLALRPGGCCASRAGFVGALAGAMLVDGPRGLPPQWAQRMADFRDVFSLAEELCMLRD